MIDKPHDPPPAQEQVIEQSLIKCGLNAKGFTVKYEHELQSIGIVIDKQAGASKKDFDCIREAAGHEIVTFKDGEMFKAYLEQNAELARPKMLEIAEQELKKRGLLENFPKRRNFVTEKLFAEALETHCGMKPGSFFVESQWGLVARPKFKHRHLTKADWDRMSCIMTSQMYSSANDGGFKFGFVGNEQLQDNKGH